MLRPDKCMGARLALFPLGTLARTCITQLKADHSVSTNPTTYQLDCNWSTARACLANIGLSAVGVGNEDLCDQPGVVCRVSRVDLDARVHDGHPALPALVQALYEGL